ncbi:MATE family efflux transporter [Flavobacterium branchiophilum NBRC 15030 = ATCC 35035]|uniref:Multidrug-efflux transporter n=1 Tax=Flavobacterium branchiophilum TaxID=55197 RepID=A0A543G1C0_9FLAO|nr:MATE family efflux transporter [Flavobacterium branchiophilum]OXA78731.1 MATE family efflux transporter [Flavobacterium branchiophilum NBRC 15030 = ATCC 35035]TQM39855.1 MATE family multidrug resistance protein [Flavobacterium branchiophilum]GEM55194.1 MATE family efflux transporter [Flavobacterium branchiophilum NBRC 15030 = ATCC 35035]
MRINRYKKEFLDNIKLATPVVFGMLGHTLIGIVDNFMVGNLGATELAAVSLGNSFIFIGMSIGIGFSTAITPLASEALAEKNDKKCRSIFHHGLLLSIILGIVLFVLIVLSKPLMLLMNQPKAVVDLATPYIDWVAFSLIPVIIFQGYKQFSDGLSLTKYAMYAVYLTNVVHVIANWMLIYGFWIFPKMGVVGAALGTVVSRLMMVVFMHYLMKNNHTLQPYFKHFSFKEIKKSVLKKIVKLGAPSAMQMLFEVTLFTAAIWLSGSLGKNSQAANQIALTLASTTFMFAMGLNVTAMIRLSYLKGLQDIKGLLFTAKSIFMLAIMLETFFAIIFIVFHQYLPHLFLNMNDANQALDNTQVIEITSKLLLIAAFFQISDGIQVVVLGALRGLQDVNVPMYITFVAYWVVGFPISYYLGKHTTLAATGIWIGLLAGLTFAAVFLYVRFYSLTKKMTASKQLS